MYKTLTENSFNRLLFCPKSKTNRGFQNMFHMQINWTLLEYPHVSKQQRVSFVVYVYFECTAGKNSIVLTEIKTPSVTKLTKQTSLGFA